MTASAIFVMIALMSVGGANGITPVFNASEPIAMYTSAAISRPTPSTTAQQLQFSVGTWLDNPYECGAFNADGSVAWTYTWPNPTDQVSLKTYAVHAGQTTSGSGLSIICVADVIAYSGAGDKSLTVLGFGAGQQTPTPMWTYSVASNCQTDAQDPESFAAISSDASTVSVLAVCRNNTDPFIAQTHILDGATGKVSCLYSVNSLASQAGGAGIAISDNGQYVAFNNYEQAYVIDTHSCGSRIMPNGGALEMGFAGSIAMSGDATYLVWGFETGVVLTWNAAQRTYVQSLVVPGTYNGKTWYCEVIAIATDSGQPLAAFGWTDDNAMTVRVDLYTVSGSSGGTPLWTYVGKTSTDDQLIPSDLALSGSYLAVSTWGDANEQANPNPQVLLFNTQSSTPLFTYVTPGSMFAIDVLAIPSSSDGEQTTDVWVAASGKSVHANVMGSGGDLYVFNQKF